MLFFKKHRQTPKSSSSISTSSCSTSSNGGSNKRNLKKVSSYEPSSSSSSVNKGISSSQQQQQQQQCCPELKLKPKKRGNEIAIVACGNFWNPQVRFQQLKGVKRVIVGYTGGGQQTHCTTTPTYKQIGDYTEALFIEYNPKKITFLEILQMWKDNDYPWEPEILRHRSAIFPMTAQQRKQAIQFVIQLSQSKPNSYLYVDIDTITKFYCAEEYHQNYISKQVQQARQHLLAWANNEVPSGLFSIPE